MPVFQLDECLNDPEFAQECEDAAHANSVPGISVRRFPKLLKKQDDSVVLRELLKLDGAVLTKDRRIAKDHPLDIPDEHPGIIIISNAPGYSGTMTVKLVKRILSMFKESFQNWHTLHLRNSIVEINQVGIDICHKSSDVIVRRIYISFAEIGWDSKLMSVLKDKPVH